MSNYIIKRVYLSDGQQNKLKAAFRNQTGITLQIKKDKTPNYDMKLTNTQINQLKKGERINISKTQLKQNGGFLPFLAALIPGLIAAGKAAAIGATTGAASYGVKKALDKITGSGCKKKRGKGVIQNWERV